MWAAQAATWIQVLQYAMCPCKAMGAAKHSKVNYHHYGGGWHIQCSRRFRHSGLGPVGACTHHAECAVLDGCLSAHSGVVLDLVSGSISYWYQGAGSCRLYLCRLVQGRAGCTCAAWCRVVQAVPVPPGPHSSQCCISSARPAASELLVQWLVHLQKPMGPLARPASPLAVMHNPHLEAW